MLQHLPAVQVILDDVDLFTHVTSIGLLFLGCGINIIRTEAHETLSVSVPIYQSMNQWCVHVCVHALVYVHKQKVEESCWIGTGKTRHHK